MGKRAAASKGRASADVEGAQPERAKPKPKPPSRNPIHRNVWPWWVWAICGFALLMSMGRLWAGGGDGGSRKGGAGAAGGKEARGGRGSSAAAAPGKELSTQRFLELALRIQEMTDLGSAVEQVGALDSEVAKQLDVELTGIEEELRGSSSTTARDLLSMVSVVRGTLYQKGKNLTDEEVEGLSSKAYTYANPRYWDDYYNKTSSDERYDWYGTWDTLIPETSFRPRSVGEPQIARRVGDLLRPYLDAESRILMLGCGNSDLSEKMYVDGYERIMNIDVSEKLLENLRSRLASSMPNMRWQLEDASALSFEDGAFDVTIDKGTLDAIEQNQPLLLGASREVHRTLRPGGFLLSITFNAAPIRVERQLMEAAAWAECHTHVFEKSTKSRGATEKSTFYVHACQKRPS